MLTAMGKPHSLNCPACGTVLHVDPWDEVVICTSCGTGVSVARPDRPLSPGTHGQGPQRRVEGPQPGSQGLPLPVLIGLIVAGIFVIAVTVISAHRFVQGWYSHTPGEQGDYAASEAAGKQREVDRRFRRVMAEQEKLLAPLKRKAASLGQGSGSEVPVLASNLRQVDPVDLLRQAIQAAKRVEPSSKLIRANFTGVEQGVLDLKGDSDASVLFEYRWLDASKPAGKDIVEGSFRITTAQGKLHTFAHVNGASDLDDKKAARAFPLPLPTCTVKDAWAVATKTGVPANATAQLFWEKVHITSGDQKTQWRFYVKGHDEYDRQIDASNCRLLRP